MAPRIGSYRLSSKLLRCSSYSHEMIYAVSAQFLPFISFLLFVEIDVHFPFHKKKFFFDLLYDLAYCRIFVVKKKRNSVHTLISHLCVSSIFYMV